MKCVGAVQAGVGDAGNGRSGGTMTEAEACVLLRDWPGDGGLEAWIAGRRWKAAQPAMT